MGGCCGSLLLLAARSCRDTVPCHDGRAAEANRMSRVVLMTPCDLGTFPRWISLMSLSSRATQCRHFGSDFLSRALG